MFVVPDNWASVVAGNSTGQNALHNTDYTLTCTVTAISGMNLAPSVEWVGPDGGVVVSGGNITVGEVETRGSISTLTLSFSPVLTSNDGRYVCRAAISVPWMDSQPPQHTASINLLVNSKLSKTCLSVQQLQWFLLHQTTSPQPPPKFPIFFTDCFQVEILDMVVQCFQLRDQLIYFGLGWSERIELPNSVGFRF